MNPIVEDIRRTLIELSDPLFAETGKRFFKEDVRLYGVKSPLVKKVSAQSIKRIRNLSKREIFEMCEQLWSSGYNEEVVITCDWAYSQRGIFEPSDFDLFEQWVNNYVTNWAMCDTLCNHTVGTFIEMYPDYIGRLKTWHRSESRWARRACAVTLILPARSGMFLNDVFEIADSLLKDGDEMVQKGYGWMLKEASKCQLDAVFEYVMARKSVMPRTALRYAIEKMPKNMREIAMRH